MHNFDHGTFEDVHSNTLYPRWIGLQCTHITEGWQVSFKQRISPVLETTTHSLSIELTYYETANYKLKLHSSWKCPQELGLSESKIYDIYHISPNLMVKNLIFPMKISTNILCQKSNEIMTHRHHDGREGKALKWPNKIRSVNYWISHSQFILKYENHVRSPRKSPLIPYDMKSNMKFPMNFPWNPQVSLGFPACCLEDFWCTQYIAMGTDIGIYSHQPPWRYSIYRDINRYYIM